MVDARVSGARAERRAGSSPVLGTMKEKLTKDVDFSFLCILSFSHIPILFSVYTLLFIWGQRIFPVGMAIFKNKELSLPYEIRSATSRHPSGCAYRQL